LLFFKNCNNLEQKLTLSQNGFAFVLLLIRAVINFSIFSMNLCSELYSFLRLQIYDRFISRQVFSYFFF